MFDTIRQRSQKIGTALLLTFGLGSASCTLSSIKDSSHSKADKEPVPMVTFPPEEPEVIEVPPPSRMAQVIAMANAVREQIYEVNCDGKRITPAGKDDPAIESDVLLAIAALHGQESLSPLEQGLAFQIAMLGQQEFSVGEPVDYLGTNASGGQVGKNDGGLVDVMAKKIGVQPNQWCSTLVLGTDAFFTPGLHDTASPLAKSHIVEARAVDAFRPKNDDYVPQMGDRLIFDTADPNGKATSGHIATVLHYDAQTDRVCFIEGNSNAAFLGRPMHDPKNDGVKLNSKKLVTSGGMVAINYYTLEQLKNGSPDHLRSDQIRCGTLIGVVDVRALAEARGVDIESYQTTQNNLPTRSSDLDVPTRKSGNLRQ